MCHTRDCLSLFLPFALQERYLEYNAHAASYTWKVLRDEASSSVVSSEQFYSLRLKPNVAEVYSLCCLSGWCQIPSPFCMFTHDSRSDFDSTPHTNTPNFKHTRVFMDVPAKRMYLYTWTEVEKQTTCSPPLLLFLHYCCPNKQMFRTSGSVRTHVSCHYF